MRSLLVLYSYHHHNTEKVAHVFAKVLDAQVKAPQQITMPEELQEYDLVGFGSGIYGGKHHKTLLDLADRLPRVAIGKAFIFSTNGAPVVAWEAAGHDDFRSYLELATKNHLKLREKLLSRGYVIVDEFSCAGFNTNKFLKLFGGINKGRPNAEDLKRAEEFALKLKQNA